MPSGKSGRVKSGRTKRPKRRMKDIDSIRWSTDCGKAIRKKAVKVLPDSLDMAEVLMEKMADIVRTHTNGHTLEENKVSQDTIIWETLHKAATGESETMVDEKKNEQDIIAIQKALVIQQVPGRTYLAIIIKDEGDPKSDEPSYNRRKNLRCHHGMAFGQGYVYDQNTDSYVVSGIDTYNLGYVSVAYQISMPGTGNWNVQIPLPKEVIERYLSAQQRRDFDVVRSNYPDKERYTFQMVQMAGCEV